MIKGILKGITLAVAVMLMAGCAAHGPGKAMPGFSGAPIDAAQYTSKIDNFVVILDASSSMGEYTKGNTKFDLAAEVAKRLNQTLPQMGQKAAFRTFGHDTGISRRATLLHYGLATYDTDQFGKAIGVVSKPGGFTPIAKALQAAQTDLADASGTTAVILISDGEQNAGNAVAAAKALEAGYDDTLCIYPVFVGESAAGMALMKELGDIGGCGFYSDAASLMSHAGMTEFVKKVFLDKKVFAAGPGDSDGDGVTDDKDQCPDTPAGVVVDAVGCPLDTDGDGVYDYLDKCPGTPKGAKVNAQGCWILGNLLFDFDKAVIKPAGFAELDAVVKIMQKNPGMNVTLQGHCDNIGTAAYNQKLSVRRANAAKDYLVNKGISMGRITCEGYGYTQPVATNTTDFGRSLNRRVEIKPEI